VLFFAFFFLPFFLAALSSGVSPSAEVTSSPPALRVRKPRLEAPVNNARTTSSKREGSMIALLLHGVSAQTS
jgi:hypothetical protein